MSSACSSACSGSIRRVRSRATCANACYSQLKNLGMEESLAARVVANHLDLLEKHRYNEIAKLLGVTVEVVNQAQKIISLLEPKPGRDYGGEEPTYVIPDVFIVRWATTTSSRSTRARCRGCGWRATTSAC